MAYEKKIWKNKEDIIDSELSQYPRFDAENMNRIESGIEEAYNSISNLTAVEVGAVPTLRRLNGTNIFNVNSEGLYYCINVDKTSIPTTTQSGYLRVEYGDSDYKVIYWRPYNSHKEYVNVLDGGKWLGWAEIFTNKGGIIEGILGIYRDSENRPKFFVGNDDEHRLEIEYYMNTLNLINVVGEHRVNLSVRNPNTVEIKDIIKLWADGTKDYTIFGEHNKPFGSYTGIKNNWSSTATAREINMGGIGNLLLVQSIRGTAFVTPKGALATHSDMQYEVEWFSDDVVCYKDGTLYAKANHERQWELFDEFNVTYTYYCI